MGRQGTARLERNLPLLRALSGAGPSRRKQIFSSCDKDLLKSICDCASNVLCGNVALTGKQKSSIGKHRRLLKALAYNTIALETKRQKYFTNQKGGFLTALLPALLAPVLTTIVAELFSKR